MDFGLQTLIYMVVAVGVGAAEATAGLMVLQGGRSWPGLAMISGGILQLAGGGVQHVASYYYITALSSFSGTVSPNEWLDVLMRVGSLCAVLGVLLFLVGLIPVCLRHGRLNRRVAELETLNEELRGRLPE